MIQFASTVRKVSHQSPSPIGLVEALVARRCQAAAATATVEQRIAVHNAQHAALPSSR